MGKWFYLLVAALGLFLGCLKKTAGSSTSSVPKTGSETSALNSSATSALPPLNEMGLLRSEIQLLKDKMEKADTELAAELRAQLQRVRDEYQTELKKTQEQLAQEGKNRQELEKKLTDLDARLTKADSDLAAQLRSEIGAKAQELAKQVSQLNEQLAGLKAQVNAIPDIYATKVEVRDQVGLAVKSLQDLLNTRVGQLETQLTNSVKALQIDTLNRFSQVDMRQTSMASEIILASEQLFQLAQEVTPKLTELSIKTDKAATDAQGALNKLNALELGGKDLVNEVGALLATIQGDIAVAPTTGASTTASSGLSQTAHVLNLLLSGFTKEAAGLIVFSYKVEEALKTRFDTLQLNYNNLLSRMVAAEQQTSQQQSQLDAAQGQLTEFKNGFFVYQNNQSAVQKKLMDDVGLLTAQLQTFQNKVDALPNPPTVPLSGSSDSAP